jgi:hypothetical protein
MIQEQRSSDGGRIVRYLCLGYVEEKQLNALPERELNAFLEESYSYVEELRAGGHLVAAECLGSVETATTLRVRNGRLSLSDGPAAETREQLGSLFVIEAGDLNTAIRLASRSPGVRYGCVEVRPIEDSF